MYNQHCHIAWRMRKSKLIIIYADRYGEGSALDSTVSRVSVALRLRGIADSA